MVQVTSVPDSEMVRERARVNHEWTEKSLESELANQTLRMKEKELTQQMQQMQ